MINEELGEKEWKEFLSKKIHGGIPKIFKNKVEEESSKLGLPNNITFQEKLFMLRNNLKEIPKCARCGSNVKFQVSTTCYMTYCSQSCSAKSNETQDKKRATNVVKYGIQNIANVNKEKRAKAVFETRFDQLDRIKHKVIPLFSKSDWKGGLSSTPYPWKCVRCETEYNSKLNRGFPPCPKCERSFTDIEQIIKTILDKNKIEYQAHNRKIIGHANKEIDFYIPAYRVAIEVHGLWYHTEKYFLSNYHQEKANICLNKDIKLVQIFSDEIIQKLNIVESKLKRILQIKAPVVIGARKCVIRKISREEAKNFLEQNHLQGKDNSTIKYGAWAENSLVGVMTFCKPRRALGHKNIENGVWELARFCTKNDKSCPGLFSKMLKVFVEEIKPKQIISYGDYRWTHPHNNVYCKSGFVYKGTSKPNYFYLKNGKRLHRFGFRKSILVKKYPEWSHLTEKQITERMQLHRVWDAGHHKFELTLTNIE